MSRRSLLEEKKWLRRAAYLAVGLALGLLCIRYLLPVVLPFLIGALIARCVDPAVRLLLRKTQSPRWVCAGACVGAFYLLLGGILWLLLRQVWRELTDLFVQLPEFVSLLAEPMARLHLQLAAVADRAPDGLGEALESWVERLFSGSAGWIDTLNSKVFTFATSFLSALPNAVLFLVTGVLSSFFLASQWPTVKKWLRNALPAPHRDRVAVVADRLRRAFGGWCIAQLKLMSVTFCIVTVGLFLIGVDYALLFGLLIALIDALPVFGTGTILVPWGLLMFARGQTQRGLALLLLYGTATLTRTALEPKLVGRQIGLNPLLTLLAIYSGYRFLGVWGMILFPIGALLLKQLWDYYARA
jgi:sporulation integral membrane protein YtvI